MLDRVIRISTFKTSIAVHSVQIPKSSFTSLSHRGLSSFKRDRCLRQTHLVQSRENIPKDVFSKRTWLNKNIRWTIQQLKALSWTLIYSYLSNLSLTKHQAVPQVYQKLREHLEGTLPLKLNSNTGLWHSNLAKMHLATTSTLAWQVIFFHCWWQLLDFCWKIEIRNDGFTGKTYFLFYKFSDLTNLMKKSDLVLIW